jgi:hypothetical protein
MNALKTFALALLQVPGFDFLDGLVKSPSAALHLRRCGVPVSTPHSSVFARLASGAFYETIVLLTFYEIDFLNWFSYYSSFDELSRKK